MLRSAVPGVPDDEFVFDLVTFHDLAEIIYEFLYLDRRLRPWPLSLPMCAANAEGIQSDKQDCGDNEKSLLRERRYSFSLPSMDIELEEVWHRRIQKSDI